MTFDRVLRSGAGVAQRLRTVHGHPRIARGSALPDVAEGPASPRPGALAAAEKKLADEVRHAHSSASSSSTGSGLALKHFAADRGVRIIGDAPIFVVARLGRRVGATRTSSCSTRTASRPSWPACRRTTSRADGQHWGNPLYDWERMEATGFAWWVARVRRQLKQVDLIRLDHFRGFCQAWHIPAGEKTARNGKWVDGPGREALRAAAHQPRRAAAHRRRPGPHHAGRDRAARELACPGCA